MKNKNIWIMGLLTLFMVLGTSATTYLTPDYFRAHPQTSGVPLQTTINGYLCNDYPDKSGRCVAGVDCAIECPYNAVGGCAIVVFNDAYQRIQEYLWNYPGTNMIIGTPYGTVFYYENYYCVTTACQCSDWNVQGCGYGCETNYKSKIRTCNSGCDLETHVCEYAPSTCGSGTSNPCSDSDGGNKPLVVGTTSYRSGEKKTDYCTSQVMLREYVCPAIDVAFSGVSDVTYKSIDCTPLGKNFGCRNGKCVSVTTTTLGGGGNGGNGDGDIYPPTTTLPIIPNFPLNNSEIILILLAGGVLAVIFSMDKKGRKKR